MRDAMLIIHFLGLAMGLGTSFAMLFLGIGSRNMEPAKGQEFMLNATLLGRMGHWGLVLLLLSGGYLMTPYWSTLGSSPLLIAKLLLYVALAGMVGLLTGLTRKARSGRTEVLPRAVLLGRLVMLTSLAIVVLAVSMFH